MKADLKRRVVAEALGTALLLATVVGSGIMGERLSGGNVALALLANTIATGAVLVALILTFGPISGAHLNPAVTLAAATQSGIPLFNDLADPAKARAISAGTTPGSRVHPEVVTAMHEIGLDLADVQPRFLSDELARSASLLVTMGCGEACPAVPGLPRDDWPLEDPKGKPVERVREIRTEIRARVAALLHERGWEKS